MSPSKFLGIPEVYSEHGHQVDHLLDVVHWFMGLLFVGWSLFFLFCLFRFWHRRNKAASYEGVKNHISSHLEVGVVIIEAVLLLGFAFPLWAKRADHWETVQEQNPARVRVVGWQYGWTYHYPGADGKFGRIDPLLISGSNDLGIDYNDPNAQDDFLSPILKIPVGRPAVLNITSKDVIHNYSIIPMRIQQDAIPGKEIPMWFTPTKAMETFVVCGQLCGDGHANMIGSMEVVTQKAYDEWFEEQTSAALKSSQPSPATSNVETPSAGTPTPADGEGGGSSYDQAPTGGATGGGTPNDEIPAQSVPDNGAPNEEGPNGDNSNDDVPQG